MNNISVHITAFRNPYNGFPELRFGFENGEYVNSIQLNETHNPGDIINFKNSKWIIINDNLYESKHYYPFPKGHWVKIYDLKYIDFIDITQDKLNETYDFLTWICNYYINDGHMTRYKVNYDLLLSKLIGENK